MFAFQVKENKEKERLERRLLDELYKIFMDSDSFYYSPTYDLTNTVQRQGASDKSDLPLWKRVRGLSILRQCQDVPHYIPYTNKCTEIVLDFPHSTSKWYMYKLDKAFHVLSLYFLFPVWL